MRKLRHSDWEDCRDLTRAVKVAFLIRLDTRSLSNHNAGAIRLVLASRSLVPGGAKKQTCNTIRNSMTQDDFDLQALAELLQVPVSRVSRMAERGRLPGRKVAGQWRFARSEIHHWVEETIGASDLKDLSKIEKWLDANADAEEARVSNWLRPETIACPLDARTRSSVIQQMVDLVLETGLLWDGPRMKEAVRDREHLHPTALDNGVALLHPRRPLTSILAEPVLAIGRTNQGIPFGGPRGELTDVFFLICSMDDTGHLQMLARISRMLADPGFLESVRTDMESSALHYWICRYEEQMDRDSS